MLGSAYSPLVDNGFDLHDRTVSKPCSKGDAAHDFELGIQLERSTAVAGISHGFLISYEANGEDATFQIPETIALCPGVTTSAYACRAGKNR
jgi:hypothetical protein